jgi:hypothetical protein
MTHNEARHAAAALSTYIHQHPMENQTDAILALMVIHSAINQIDPPQSPLLDHEHAAEVFQKTFIGDD